MRQHARGLRDPTPASELHTTRTPARCIRATLARPAVRPAAPPARGHTARSAKPLPYDHSPSGRRARRTASDAATGSVDCSTSISRSRDVCGVSGTHTVVGATDRLFPESDHAPVVATFEF